MAQGLLKPDGIPKGARERVSGELHYVDDLLFPGMLYGRFVRLKCPRARLRRIDKTQALGVPGVEAVFSAEDFPAGVPRFGPLQADQPILAEHETRYEGEPVAIVLAKDADAAARGAGSVKVTWDPLPAVTTISQAILPDAPLVQDPQFRSESAFRHTNFLGEWNFGWGDLTTAVEKSCDLILQNNFFAPFIHHFALEPFSVIAGRENDGLILYAAIQHPFVLRRILAEMIGLPLSMVRIVAMDMGGGFGGRGYPKIEPLAAMLAWRTGRTVKISLTGEEGFYHAQREAAQVDIRTGFTRDGRLVFQDVHADFLIGAYADISARVVAKSAYLGAGPYRVPIARIRARGVLSNTPPTTAFRGFGATHFNWAVESQMTLAAQALGLDPVAIRLINLPARGEKLVPNDNPCDGDWAGLVQKAAEAVGWRSPKSKGRGRGIAIGIKSSVPATLSEARVRLYADSSATVYVGTTEMGQGSKSVMAKLCADALGIPVERVSVVSGDTGQVPFDTITASSRSTVMMGLAVIAACEDVKQQLCRIVADAKGVPSDQVQTAGGRLIGGDWAMTYREAIVHKFGWSLGELTGHGRYQGERDPLHPLGGPAAFWEVIVTAVELSVDRDTGFVNLHKLASASDAGRLINPLRAVGQDEGGAVMAIGAALMEQILMDPNGKIINAGSLDYKVPGIADIPEEMLTIFQENEDGPGPFGAKGLGESGILATAPAICGAIRDCCGVYPRRLPVTPESLWRELSGFHSEPVGKGQDPKPPGLESPE
jgi:CO/xanthine dehydrogenase Mo-binding subunit